MGTKRCCHQSVCLSVDLSVCPMPLARFCIVGLWLTYRKLTGNSKREVESTRQRGCTATMPSPAPI